MTARAQVLVVVAVVLFVGIVATGQAMMLGLIR